MKRTSLLLLVLLIAGCTPSSQENDEKGWYPILTKYVGKEVTIQFKRNELGLSATNMLLAPTSTGLNSNMASIRGELIEVSADGLFVTGLYSPNPGSPLREFDSWIPHQAVLTVITRNEPLKK